jgi:hypothetical protein
MPILAAASLSSTSRARAADSQAGYRSILIFCSGERAIFVFAFAKGNKANLSAAELKVYRKAASVMLELGDDQIETEVEAGRLVGVKDNEQG